MIKFIAIVLFCLSVFPGCALKNARGKQDIAVRTTPICSSDLECKEKMALARMWVTSHSPFAIQIINDDYIQTGSNPRTMALSVRVSKEPTRVPGQYAIAATMWCGDGSAFTMMVDCHPVSAWDGLIDFNEYVEKKNKN